MNSWTVLILVILELLLLSATWVFAKDRGRREGMSTLLQKLENSAEEKLKTSQLAMKAELERKMALIDTSVATKENVQKIINEINEEALE